MIQAKECTWQDCHNLASVPQLDNDGNEWANLCDEHARQIDAAVDSLDPKAILSAWVRAMGGAKKAAERM